MEKKYDKKEKIFENYSYRKNRTKGNQQTNILKTYNNINNEIIINIKNNEKYSNDKDKKFEVRRIRLKLPNELIKKSDTLDFLNLNLRDTNHSINSSNQRIPSSLLYNQNIQNKKMKLEQLINDFSLRNKYDTSNNISNNTFKFINDNAENSSVIKKNEKKEKQIPLNKVNNIKYYKKPVNAVSKFVYHKINNLSYRNKKQSTNSTSKNKLILENMKSNHKINPINSFTQIKESENNNSKINIKKDLNHSVLIKKYKYEKINPLDIKGGSRKNFVPINVNRNKKFYSNNSSKIKDEESISNLNNSNIITKTRNTFNRKSFRFLVNQTNKNTDLSSSFSKCYNNNSRIKPLLKNSQILSNNDSLNYSNAYYDTESYNESTYNNYNDINNKKQTKYNTQNNLLNLERDNKILINDESNTEKNIKDIPSKKYLLSVLTTPKYHLIRDKPRTNTNAKLSLSSYSIDSDLKNKARNISAISLSGINLDLYYLQEKMKLVIDKIRDNEQCSNECYNYIQYFFEHDFYNEILKPFKKEENIKIIMNYIKLEIICYFLCYNICLGEDFKKAEILLKSIFDILFNNFILYLCLVVSQCKNKNDNIIIVLNKIIKDNLNDDLLLNHDYNFNYNLNENKYFNIISSKIQNIKDYYNIIINNIYKNNNKNKEIIDINFPEFITNLNNKEINDIQCEKIIPYFCIEIKI